MRQCTTAGRRAALPENIPEVRGGRHQSMASVPFCKATSHMASTVLARGDAHVATAIIESPKDLR